MADVLTRKSLILLKVGAVLPTATDFLETTEALIPSPKPVTTEISRLTGKLGYRETLVDKCKVVLDGASITHTVREMGTDYTIEPEYSDLLQIGGYSKTYDATTPGQESYTYSNNQTPTRGSMIHYLDGKKQTFTDCVVASTSIVCELGQAVTINGDLSAYYDNKGIPVNEANPTVTENDEPAMIVSCADIVDVAGNVLQANSVTITLAPDIKDTYAMGRKSYDITDYVVTIAVSFNVESANYADQLSQIQTQAPLAIDIKINADDNGNLVNGKSMHITAPFGKLSDFTDSDNENAIQREGTYTLTPDSTDADQAVKIKLGFFA